MMFLREYRPRGRALADYLPWAALIAPGVVLNKDGSFQRSAAIRGPDLDSATPAELVATTGRLNGALRRLGSSWAIFVEAQRVPAQDYPHARFPDPVSALVDRERHEQFAEEGAHYESVYFLTLQWMPPAEDAARAENLLYEGRSRGGVDPSALLASFIDRSGRLLQLLEGFLPEARWLDDAETLTYLHSTVSTRRQRVRVPETPMYLDAILADVPLVGGLEPQLGDQHLRTLTITGFPSQTFPGQLRLDCTDRSGLGASADECAADAHGPARLPTSRADHPRYRPRTLGRIQMSLKLGPLADDKPVRLTIEVPADVFRDLAAYAEAHASTTGQPSQGPSKLIVPMLCHFMASDRTFARLRRT